MSTTRIRGTWLLNLMTFDTDPSISCLSLGRAELVVNKASRAGLTGVLTFGTNQVPVNGRVKPGSPAVVTLSETGSDGNAIEHGLQAIFYIPPWLPTVDYSYDVITGILNVGHASVVKTKAFQDRPISVVGIQPFSDEQISVVGIQPFSDEQS